MGRKNIFRPIVSMNFAPSSPLLSQGALYGAVAKRPRQRTSFSSITECDSRCCAVAWNPKLRQQLGTLRLITIANLPRTVSESCEMGSVACLSHCAHGPGARRSSLRNLQFGCRSEALARPCWRSTSSEVLLVVGLDLDTHDCFHGNSWMLPVVKYWSLSLSVISFSASSVPPLHRI